MAEMAVESGREAHFGLRLVDGFINSVARNSKSQGPRVGCAGGRRSDPDPRLCAAQRLDQAGLTGKRDTHDGE